MGWDYINRIAYGVEMIAWDNNEIEPLLTKYKNILSYDKDMASAPKGSIFVYVDSTYKILDEDHGSYSGGRLDTLGGTFNRPRHECIHERHIVSFFRHYVTNENMILSNIVKPLVNYIMWAL